MKTTFKSGHIAPAQALSVLLLTLILSLASPASLAVEQVLPFSAKLADKQGVPLDGQYAISFRIYTEPAGGQPVWTEVHSAASVTKGVLSVNLGSISGFGALELIEGYWLGIAVGADAEMTPRVQVPAQSIVPAGTVAPFGGEATQVPRGWILCDGRELASAAYPRLYKAIGKAWGSSTVDKFRVPDLQGLFLRGVDGTANRDPDKASRSAIAPGGNGGMNVGSYQEDQFKSHVHNADPNNKFMEFRYQAAEYSGWQSAGNSVNLRDATQPAGGSETRPKNAYVNYIIKY